jgi:hypothetical protein
MPNSGLSALHEHMLFGILDSASVFAPGLLLGRDSIYIRFSKVCISCVIFDTMASQASKYPF